MNGSDIKKRLKTLENRFKPKTIDIKIILLDYDNSTFFKIEQHYEQKKGKQNDKLLR